MARKRRKAVKPYNSPNGKKVTSGGNKPKPTAGFAHSPEPAGSRPRYTVIASFGDGTEEPVGADNWKAAMWAASEKGAVFIRDEQGTLWRRMGDGPSAPFKLVGNA